jgi:peptidoglycan hydrolase-like protein with peptidoglycan-binding domain
MQRCSRSSVHGYLNSAARLCVAFSGLNAALDKSGKITLLDSFNLSRHFKMPEKSSEKRSVYFKNTSSSADLEIDRQYPGVLELRSTGNGVLNLQYFIAYLSQFYDTIPAVAIDGRFGESTRAAVQAVQRTFGLPPDGIVGERTWYELYRAYVGIVNTIPLEYVSGYTVPYGGVPLRIGAESESVRLLQEYLNYIAQTYTEIPRINPTGYFGPRTQEAVIAFQNRFGFTPTGVVSAVTWTAITELYNALYKGVQLQDGQFPGFAVGG